jgi:hypothetical protein
VVDKKLELVRIVHVRAGQHLVDCRLLNCFGSPCATHADLLGERRVEDRLSHIAVEDLLPHLLG